MQGFTHPPLPCVCRSPSICQQHSVQARLPGTAKSQMPPRHTPESRTARDALALPTPARPLCVSLFSFEDFIYLFRQRGREGEREGEKHQCVAASCMSSTGGLARSPGVCPHWESNQRPFGSQASTQSTEPHQPGLRVVS